MIDRQRPLTTEQIWREVAKGRLDDETAGIVQSMIANMIFIPATDEERELGFTDMPQNRLREIEPYTLTPDMLRAAGMHDEALVFRVLEYCHHRKIPPTPETIEQRLSMDIDPDRAREIVDGLVHKRTMGLSVRSLAFGLGEWMQRRAGLLAMQEAHKIMADKSRLWDHAYAEAMALLASVAPAMEKREGMTYLEMFDLQEEKTKEWARMIRNGEQPGVTSPWKPLNEKLLFGIPEGEAWLGTGPSKVGKTTIVGEWAHHVGFEVPGWMALHIHLETTGFDLMTREMARETMILLQRFRDGTIHPGEHPWRGMYDDMRDKILSKIGDGPYAKYHYEWAPSMSFDRLREILDDYQARAAAADMRLMVFLDYFQRMRADRGESLNDLAVKVMDEFPKRKLAAFVFAQDHVDHEGRNMPFGGQQIVHVCKGHIQFERDMEAKNDLPLYVYETGDDGKLYVARDAEGDLLVQRDLLDDPVFLHRKGQVDSLLRGNIRRANQAKTGKFELRTFNGRFRIVESEKVSLKRLAGW